LRTTTTASNTRTLTFTALAVSGNRPSISTFAGPERHTNPSLRTPRQSQSHGYLVLGQAPRSSLTGYAPRGSTKTSAQTTDPLRALQPVSNPLTSLSWLTSQHLTILFVYFLSRFSSLLIYQRLGGRSGYGGVTGQGRGGYTAPGRQSFTFLPEGIKFRAVTDM
jgi:hypothetical protein